MRNLIALIIYALLSSMLLKAGAGLIPNIMALIGFAVTSILLSFIIDDYIKSRTK